MVKMDKVQRRWTSISKDTGEVNWHNLMTKKPSLAFMGKEWCKLYRLIPVVILTETDYRKLKRKSRA